MIHMEEQDMKEKRKSHGQLDQLCAGCHGQGAACKTCVNTFKMEKRPYSKENLLKKSYASS